MIRVLVVDDSAFMRKAISSMLSNDPEIRVLGTAENGRECLEKIRQLHPDVVTLDLEMPVMDGITALKYIMMEMPCPVLILSSLSIRGAGITLKALEYGAVDFIAKDLGQGSFNIVRIENELRTKVRAIARRRLSSLSFAAAPGISRKPQRAASVHATSRAPVVRDIVAIGVSTGGPSAVKKILSELPADFPACILIAQHMPKTFTGPFAERLNETSLLEVKEASPGDVVEPGKVFVAPGGSHLKIRRRTNHIDVVVASEPSRALYKPSVNELFLSVARTVGSRGLGVILTGMGSDGCEGSRFLKTAGGRVLVQSNATCVVYGMPRAVVDAGMADAIVDLDEMPCAIEKALY